MESRHGSIENGVRVPAEDFIVTFMDGKKETYGIDRHHLKELKENIENNNPMLQIGGTYYNKACIKSIEF